MKFYAVQESGKIFHDKYGYLRRIFTQKSLFSVRLISKGCNSRGVKYIKITREEVTEGKRNELTFVGLTCVLFTSRIRNSFHFGSDRRVA